MSTSRLPTTPTRAITSTLATRSSPSIPAPNQVYEPAVKHVLLHRLIYNIFLYSALLSWVQSVAWRIWARGGPSAIGAPGLLLPFLPSTLFNAFIRWIVGALPVVVLRKAFMTSMRTSSTSPSRSVKTALSIPRTLRALITYTSSALLIVLIHIVMAYGDEPGVYGIPQLTLFVKSRKHPHYLNGRILFLLVSQLSTALGFLLRNVMLDRFVFRWTVASKPRNSKWPLSAIDVLKAFLVAVLSASIIFPFSATVFALARFTLPILHKIPVLHILLRPFTAHFLKGPWTIFLPLRHFPLLIRAWFVAFTTISTWEFSDILFDVFISQPVSVSHMTADPNITLMSGVSSTDGIFRYFAYCELSELSADQSTAAIARRTAIFGDQKYTPNLWSHLARQSLLLLGHDYQLFLRRGKPPTPVLTPPAAKTLPLLNTGIAVPAPLLKTHIYRSHQHSPIRTVIDSLGSDGPLARALDAGADAANIPELFRTVESTILPRPLEEEVKKTTENATGTVSRLRDKSQRVFGILVPTWVQIITRRLDVWWTAERVDKIAQACLPNVEADVAVVNVLSYLTCASLSEDKYGVVQRDIPKVLEAMLSFLSAIEEYRAELTSLNIVSVPGQEHSAEEVVENNALRLELKHAGDILGVLEDALKDGVARIVRTFGDKLLAFKFPPRTARKLQGFVEYCS